MLLETPIGPLTLRGTEHGLTAIDFGGEPGPSTSLLIDAAAQLTEYFAGHRRSFSIPLDLPGDGFRARAQAALCDIPFGETVSYSELAAACGNPKAVRAVGSACATNPLPIIRPCHRVLRADGSLGGYRGGLDVKMWLLDHEKRIRGNL
ncbi:methylated-DNA--[protein]-cysteine S-methyltransferase [Corynebacterium sp.]|uniref:methylated-DNA--[protein]-cysteine S-methyltransferase n=1 Tax=Corynebacterium sp. TaxID=1720 RepID=UPI0026DF96C9|nr:methylated-DNA--[protein]-cysteine S-methyltransferase [Corynebacterium sp.]MDO5513341.1 methylated-DNA--[protein]-cysteine S-methyltransferase [Corynebacterium sp.]